MYSSQSITTALRFESANGRLRSKTPLTDDQLRFVAPSIFAEQAHASRSARYAYIPTSEILAQLRREGFEVFSVAQSRARDESRQEFTKHMLRLRHRDTAGKIQVGDHFHEIALINSHDGSSSYQLLAGLFRLACSNGMVVSKGLVEDIRVPHMGDISGRVIDGCITVLSKLPEVSERVREFQALRLNDGERNAFATAALAVRYDEKDAPIGAEKLLTTHRNEDRAPDLYTTLNVVQENVIRGGIRYLQRTDRGSFQRRRTREVKGIDQDVKLNRALWVLAEEMGRLKANV